MKEKEVKKKKFSHKELKKSRIRKKMLNHSLKFVIVELVIILVFLALILFFPSSRSYSDENTVEYKGTVVDVQTKSIHAGYNTRRMIIYCIKLNNGENFVIKPLKRIDDRFDDFDDLKSLILNQEVTIRSDKYNEERLVYLPVDENVVCSYDTANQIAKHNRVAMSVTCLSVLILPAMLWFVDLLSLRREYKFCSI